MPETGAALVAAFTEGGAAAGIGTAAGEAASYAAIGEAGLGAAAGGIGAGAAAGGLGAGLAGLGADAELGAAGASFGAGVDAAGLAGADALGTGIAGTGAGGLAAEGLGAGGGLSSSDLQGLYGQEGYGAQASPAEMASGAGGGNLFSTLSNVFSPGGTSGASLFGKAGQGMGLMQVISSLYGLEQSKKLQKQASAPGMTAAGLQAVQRSMAAQGYQGSGNMAAALERYGAETNVPNIPGVTAGITGQLSSLGLLTAGIPKLAGWGNDTPQATGG